MQYFFEEFLELLPSSSPRWISLGTFFFLNLSQRRTFPQDVTRLGGRKIACIAVCSWQKGLYRWPEQVWHWAIGNRSHTLPTSQVLHVGFWGGPKSCLCVCVELRAHLLHQSSKTVQRKAVPCKCWIIPACLNLSEACRYQRSLPSTLAHLDN